MSIPRCGTVGIDLLVYIDSLMDVVLSILRKSVFLCVGNWLKLDDDKVSMVKEEDILKLSGGGESHTVGVTNCIVLLHELLCNCYISSRRLAHCLYVTVWSSETRDIEGRSFS